MRDIVTEAVPAALRVDDPAFVPVLASLGVEFRGGAAQPRRVGSIYAVDAPPAVLELLARLGWTFEIGQRGPTEPDPTDVRGRRVDVIDAEHLGARGQRN